MEQNILKIGIAVVAVGAPAAGAQIHFNISGTGRIATDLQNSASKIRPTFHAGKTGMKNPDTFSLHGFQFITP